MKGVSWKVFTKNEKPVNHANQHNQCFCYASCIAVYGAHDILDVSYLVEFHEGSIVNKFHKNWKTCKSCKSTQQMFLIRFMYCSIWCAWYFWCKLPGGVLWKEYREKFSPLNYANHHNKYFDTLHLLQLMACILFFIQATW